MSKNEEPRWFQAQYEKLPYICFACGKMGHSEIECPTPVERDEHGKLPYDVQLRAPEERRQRIQSFAGAAMESFGSGSSSAFRPPRQHSRPGERGSMSGSRHSESFVDESKDPEVQSPLKQNQRDDLPGADDGGPGASRHLDLHGDDEGCCQHARKRKSKVASPVTQTPNLNIPIGGSSALVPAGLVNSRVNQLDAGANSDGSSMIETLKKQKRGNNLNARSAAAAAEDSPPPGTMNLLSVNYRGCGRPEAVQELCHLVEERRPTVVFLMETRMGEERALGLKRNLGFPMPLLSSQRVLVVVSCCCGVRMYWLLK
jgi:hypothetical protein